MREFGWAFFHLGRLRLAGSSSPQLKHSEGGRNREECWQDCEENCDEAERLRIGPIEVTERFALGLHQHDRRGVNGMHYADNHGS